MDRRIGGILELLEQNVAAGIGRGDFLAFATAPLMPLAPSVSTTLAPYAASSLRRSMLMVSGMVSVNGMPRAAATNAKAMPVLPLVGSTSSLPGPSKPRFSASQTRAAPMRHLTE